MLQRIDDLDQAGLRRASISKPALDHFLRFALGEATWRTNFRDFGAAIRRMATLGDGGRIGEADIEGELVRLRASWRSPEATGMGADEFQGAAPRVVR